MQNEQPGKNKNSFTLQRTFNAPRIMVFEAFSTASAMAKWWGPVGYQLTIARFEFKPNGVFLYKMESPERAMWARITYGTIKKPELIEFTLCFSNEAGGVTRAPFFDVWPLEIFNALRFTEQGEKTTIRLDSFPVNASEEEFNSFMQETASMTMGWGASFDVLERYLAQ